MSTTSSANLPALFSASNGHIEYVVPLRHGDEEEYGKASGVAIAQLSDMLAISRILFRVDFSESSVEMLPYTREIATRAAATRKGT